MWRTPGALQTAQSVPGSGGDIFVQRAQFNDINVSFGVAAYLGEWATPPKFIKNP